MSNDPGLRYIAWRDYRNGYDRGHERHVVFFRRRTDVRYYADSHPGILWSEFRDQREAERHFGLEHRPSRVSGRRVALPKRKREQVS